GSEPRGLRWPRALGPPDRVRPLLASAAFGLAAPGTAAGAGLSLNARDLRTAAPLHVKRFQLVGLHWRGSGTVLFRTHSLRGRWSGWRPAAPGEDDLPDRGTAGVHGWRIAAPVW